MPSHQRVPDRSPSSGTRDRTWEQRSADGYLADYPYRLELRGTPQSLTWPDRCANCGDGSTERLHIRKAFYRHGRGRHYPGFLGYRVVSFDLPLCASCGARHRELLPRPPWLRRHLTFLLNPAHIATIGCAVLLWMTLPTAAEFSADWGWRAWGLPAIFVAGMAWTIGVTWMISRPDRFEPRTEVSLACDVSHSVGQGLFFEGRRFVYGFRNKTFADAFEQANASYRWTEQDQARMSKRSGLLAILFLAVLVGARLALWYVEGK